MCFGSAKPSTPIAKPLLQSHVATSAAATKTLSCSHCDDLARTFGFLRHPSLRHSAVGRLGGAEGVHGVEHPVLAFRLIKTHSARCILLIECGAKKLHAKGLGSPAAMGGSSRSGGEGRTPAPPRDLQAGA